MMRAAAMILISVCLSGCATRMPRFPDPPPNRETVQLPEHTPYDADPPMRAVYLNYYWFGYDHGVRRIGISFCDNGHPWYEVQRDGYSAGRDSGAAAFVKSRNPNSTHFRISN